MGRPIDMATRIQIIEQCQKGHSKKSISKSLSVSYPTVIQLTKRYEKEGSLGLKPKYHNCGPSTIKSNYLLYRASLWLKRLHPQWGAPFILVLLKERYGKNISEDDFPSERTLQRWFKKAGYNKPREKKMGKMLQSVSKF